MRNTGRAVAVVSAFTLSVVAAQEPERQPRVIAHEEVQLRTVKVIVQPKSKTAKAPRPEDFDVLEDGQRVEVVDLERLARAEEAEPAKPSAPAETRRDELEEPARKLAQVLYIDTTF